MGSTTIRIRAEDKGRLRRLQQGWPGRPPTQTDLLSMTLKFALERREEFLVEAAWKPLSAKEIARWDSLAQDLGRWDATDVDDVVYGEP